MNIASTASQPSLYCFHGQRRTKQPSLLIHTQSLSVHIASSLSGRRRRRRRRRRPRPHPTDPNRTSKLSPPDRDSSISVDLENIAERASASLTRFILSSEAKFHQFLTSGAEAFDDLRTSVRVIPGHRIVFSCRHSSLLFVANLFIWSFALVVAVRAVVWLGFWKRWRFGDRWAVVRRDRSLGGRELVVGRRVKGREGEMKGFRVLVNPLSDAKGSEVRVGESVVGNHVGKKEKLPEWWPEFVSLPEVSMGKEEFQMEAD